MPCSPRSRLAAQCLQARWRPCVAVVFVGCVSALEGARCELGGLHPRSGGEARWRPGRAGGASHSVDGTFAETPRARRCCPADWPRHGLVSLGLPYVGGEPRSRQRLGQGGLSTLSIPPGLVPRPPGGSSNCWGPGVVSSCAEHRLPRGPPMAHACAYRAAVRWFHMRPGAFFFRLHRSSRG